MQTTIENPACCIISAEEEDCSAVTEINLNFTKLTYYTKDEIKSFKLNSLIPNEIASKHNEMLLDRSKKSIFDGKVTIDHDLYLQIKSGYLLIARTDIFLLNHLAGRSWCINLYPSYTLNCLMVVTQSGLYEGCTELCSTFSLPPNIDSKEKIYIQPELLL